MYILFLTNIAFQFLGDWYVQQATSTTRSCEKVTISNDDDDSSIDFSVNYDDQDGTAHDENFILTKLKEHQQEAAFDIEGTDVLAVH